MIRKLKKNILKNLINRAFSARNIPYNFEGVKNIESTITSTKQIKGILVEFFGPDVTNGFVMAYDSYLDAIVDKDFEYFDEICEPSMSEKIKRNMSK